ncbi:GAF domain phosphoenolpyruvate--protein phosphotransferase PtsP [Geotalea daltonii FRC-32]|uniref:phosphoenolpyruvate--protein phosphotransferase n=1 Tax=Geotalea daltonii (strain DSM 22248 / JCM 15807 / FRC-32) TaxID=316067 RepID=B9M5S6_GEODF|nr:phosphoenolpyruvate--protein phosphotransferase [Geotalea daltonii]ACM21835.1 GAF domain phosphoenolpyruvate--protein phosphotransferase PtsP [Geotalea daltonii FRC-32]
MGDERHETLGLRTLEDISGLILHSHDLQETLDNIVNLVAKRVGSDVCSIYLLEDDGETLRLKATKGLSRGSVGKITMKTSEGLTGLAVEDRSIIATDNAPLHPRYKYFRETREEKFLSFLGVPLFERKTPVGVLVVQTREARVFTPAEISTISTIAYQISSIVINAKLLDSIHQKEKERAFFASELEKMKASEIKGRVHPEQEKKRKLASLIGTPVSPGFAWGKIYIFSRNENDGIDMEHAASRPEERKRFQIALEKAKIQTLYMEKRVAEVMSKEDAAIFHSHLMFLEDRGFITKITDSIDNGYSAGQAIREVVDYYVNAFAKMEDPYLRERSADMEDIGRRLLGALNGNSSSRKKFREKRIIVADDILPSDMATMDHEKVLGIVTERGNAGSHAAIMAKSLGIPAVVGIDGLMKQISPRNEVIVDGTSGHLYINPDQRIKEEYERLQRDFSLKQRELEGLRDLPAETVDGSRVFLRANIGLLNDVKVAQASGAEGVGLYRTEFPYMTRKTFPNRIEQYNLYRKIVEGFPSHPVTIRTLDIGGDKGLSYFPFPKEDNPFMGWRSIRVSLEEEDIFREQLAAILMASVHGKITVMFPMISSVEEIRTVKRILEEVKDELTADKKPFNPTIPLGVMVEIPAAVQIAHLLIREVDFFSIGTNDLIQYTLAADRNNPKVKQYYDPYHPAILHSIKRVADVAGAAGKKVSICGEMAADPINAILLLGMGISDFSLTAPYIPLIKQAILKITMAEAREISAAALQMESSADIREYLAKAKAALKL